MNLIEVFSKQVEIWNAEEKCGFCWTFGGVTDRAGIERYKIREESKCCVHVFITDRTTTKNYTYPHPNPFHSEVICGTNFNLWLLVPSEIDLNNYNEIEGHPIEESLESTILSPLRNCVGCDEVLDMCETAGYLFNTVSWTASDVYRIFSNNYTGLRISINLNERN